MPATQLPEKPSPEAILQVPVYKEDTYYSIVKRFVSAYAKTDKQHTIEDGMFLYLQQTGYLKEEEPTPDEMERSEGVYPSEGDQDGVQDRVQDDKADK